MTRASAALCLLLVVVAVGSVAGARNPREFQAKLALLNKLYGESEDHYKSKGVKCVGGNTCCNSNNKCGIGEGDCDSDSDCLDGLVCGNDLNNCDKIKIPMYEHWKLPTTKKLEFNVGSDDCCQLPRDLISYFERTE